MINQEIHPNQILDRPALKTLLGLTDRAIGREVNEGRLLCHWRVNRQWFIGSEVLDWLKCGKSQRGTTPEDEDSDL